MLSKLDISKCWTKLVMFSTAHGTYVLNTYVLCWFGTSIHWKEHFKMGFLSVGVKTKLFKLNCISELPVKDIA